MKIIENYNKIRVLDLNREEIRIREELDSGNYDQDPNQLSKYTLLLSSLINKKSDLLKTLGGIQNAN